MQIIKGKRCPKCGSSNVYLEYDPDYLSEHCLICGYTDCVTSSVPVNPVEEEVCS